ncbi:MAG: hypothetical protein ACPL7E_00500 [bacterium]
MEEENKSFVALGKIEEIKLQETMMIVDGHVGKVFCRTGLLNEVFFESKQIASNFLMQALCEMDSLPGLERKLIFWGNNSPQAVLLDNSQKERILK